MNSAEGFALIITLWRHKKSLKLVYAKTLSAKTLKLVLAINSNLKVLRGEAKICNIEIVPYSFGETTLTLKTRIKMMKTVSGT